MFGKQAQGASSVWTIAARQVGEDFDPALGFVNRPGTRDYTTKWRKRIRPQNTYFRWYQFGTNNEYITDLDDQLETRENKLAFEFQNQATDELRFYVFKNREIVDTAFYLPDSLIVPTGTYQNYGAIIQSDTFPQDFESVQSQLIFRFGNRFQF